MLMQVISVNDPLSINLACAALGRGELVIYPTETCYGIAVDIANPKAISNLLLYKGDRYRQIAIAANSHSMAAKYVKINEIASNLYKNFLPGPITIISKSKHITDTRLESVDGNLGIRIPNYVFALGMIKIFEKPITATSANTSGKKEPYSLEDWQKYTTLDKQNMVSIFIDAGKLIDRPTSTVVDTTLNDPEVLRQGQLVIRNLKNIYTSHSTVETKIIAGKIIKKYLTLTHKYPLILALQGELGVGKTQFIKGVSTALNIDTNVSSPTYTIMKEYPYQTPKYTGMLYHIDTWRLSDPTEIETTLHISTLLKPGNIIAVEWAGKAKQILEIYEKDVPTLVINIKEIDAETRQISYAFTTPEWS